MSQSSVQVFDITTTEFKMEHLNEVEEDINEKHTMSTWYVSMLPETDGVTILWDGKPEACFGYFDTEYGTDTWLVVTHKMQQRPLLFARMVRSALNALVAHKGRVYTHCDVDYKHQQWVEILGFEFEKLVNYRDDEGHDLTALRFVKGS